MSTYHLRTIGTPSCVGPRGALTLDDPLLVPLLGILAVAGSDGIEREELVVLLTPNATSSQARNELDRLLALVGAECGDEHLVAQRGTRLMLTPGAVSVDFALLPAEAEHATSAFLRDADIKDAPEFADWLAAARRRVRPKEIDATPPQGRPAMASARTVDTQRTSRWITVALMLLVAVTAAVVMTRPRRTAGFVAGDPVLLADIENTTGDTLLDRGILSAASIALQQSAHLRLYSRARLPAVYERMRITNRDTALTFELAQEVAERDRVRFVLGLQLDRTELGYRVTARLADVVLGKD